MKNETIQNNEMKFKLTQSATLVLTPVGKQIKVTVLEKSFTGGPKSEELGSLEELASMGLRKTKNLAYRGGFRRLMLDQHPAENGILDTEIKIRVSQTFGSNTGYVDMSLVSETAEII